MPTSVEHRQFTDPEQLSARLRSGSGHYRVLGRGAFTAELTLAELGSVTIQCARESLARVAFNALPAGRIAVLGWPRGGALPIVRGVQMRAGALMSIGGGAESFHRTSESVDYVALLVDGGQLAQVAIDLEARELQLESGLVCLQSAPTSVRLLRLIDDARRVVCAHPGIFASPSASRALEQSLLHAVVACLANGAPRKEPAVSSQRARIMARFEEVVEANSARPLHLPELCRLVGVPERTLRKFCQQHLGMGPHQYLLRRRIHLARRALLLGHPGGATVTSIATSHGFWDLGRFAAVYRSIFGEAPSATLRRQQAEFA